MKNQVRAIFLLMCSLMIAGSAVYADLKKGNYSPAQLGSIQQAVPAELSPDSSYEVPAYPGPGSGSRPRGRSLGCPILRHPLQQPALPHTDAATSRRNVGNRGE